MWSKGRLSALSQDVSLKYVIYHLEITTILSKVYSFSEGRNVFGQIDWKDGKWPGPISCYLKTRYIKGLVLISAVELAFDSWKLLIRSKDNLEEFLCTWGQSQ